MILVDKNRTHIWKPLLHEVAAGSLDPDIEGAHFAALIMASTVSLSTYSTIGSLMGNMTSGSMFIEGRLVRLVDISLYGMHQVVIYGKFKTLLFVFLSRINNRLRPPLKLH